MRLLNVGTQAVLTILLAGATSRAADIRLPTIPAHWVEDTDDVEPMCCDFTFDALSFSSPLQGWFVGNRYILRLDGQRLELQFLRGSDVWLDEIQAAPSGEVFAAGFHSHHATGQKGVLLRRDGASWHREDLAPPADFPEWSVGFVRVDDGGGWAMGHGTRTEGFRDLLWQREGEAWRLESAPDGPDGSIWNLIRMCLEPSGDAWFVGAEWTAERQQRGLVVRRRAGRFERAPLPHLPGPNSWVNHVACLAGGRAIAAGMVNVSGYALTTTEGIGILLQYDGSDWRAIELPSHLYEYHVSALAALSATDVWLALSALDDAPAKFVHWHDQRWEEVPPPALPDGRIEGYGVSDMQFVSATEGWAVGNDSKGSGLVGGLIFHYKDGVWRQRNWNWHFWHQPYFGLFGD